MPPFSKQRMMLDDAKERQFRRELADGLCVEEAAQKAGITRDKAVFICRRDPIMMRLVDQEVSLAHLKKQAMAVLNDATNPQTTGGWDRKDVMTAARLVITTVEKVKPELLLEQPEQPMTLRELAVAASTKRPGTEKAPGSDEPQ